MRKIFQHAGMLHLRRLSLIEQCADLLRDSLSQGRWQGPMPGVIRLAQELDVSTHTLRAALRLMESEQLIAMSEDGRSRIATGKASQIGRQQRIGILLVNSFADESPHSIQFFINLHRSLECAGFLPFFSSPTSQTSLRRDVAKVRDYISKTPADAWIVSCGTNEILKWFAEQPFPSFALFGRREEVQLASAGPEKGPAVVEATRELIRLGHQRIVFLCRQLRRLPAPGPVEQGFLAEMAAHGLSVSEFNLPDWDETAGGLHSLLNSLFQITPPTAMIIDELPPLIATQQFLALRRMRVPEQVSLVTTDYDTSFSLCQPTIAHINWQQEPIIRRTIQWVQNVSCGREDRRPTKSIAKFVVGGTIARVWKGGR
jgi:DNA-binding LacI/PurR family transcriptional regulator